jgi:DNA-binding Lrp family transcriptional regulator
MIKVLHGQEKESYSCIKNRKGVKEVFPILGEYNLFVIIQARDKTQLYSYFDEIKERPEVVSIWNILISKEDVSTGEEYVWPKFDRLESSVSQSVGAIKN